MVKCSWSDSQSSSGDVVHVFRRCFGRRWNHRERHARFSLCVVNETARIESRLLHMLLNRSQSRGCQTLINQRRAASSRTHLVLQAYCLTDVDEINPLGIEIWYRTTRHFSILGGIEAIRSVPKKYRTRYPALVAMTTIATGGSACDVTHSITSIKYKVLYTSVIIVAVANYFFLIINLLIHKLPQVPYRAFPLDLGVWAQQNLVYSASPN